jgi:transcriptional regulator with XRE-family HTH domain
VSQADKTPATPRVRELRERLGLSPDNVAAGAGLSVRTYHNVVSGNSPSRRARQLITNALRTDEIWPGIKVTERLLWLTPETVIEFHSTKDALRAEQEFRGVAERQGRVVIITKPVLLRLDQAATGETSADRNAAELEKSQEVLNAT